MAKKSADKLTETFDACSTDKERIDFLLKENVQLRNQLLAFTQDSMFGMYFAENRKANEIAASLNSFTLSLESDGKVFERYLALKKVQPEILKILDSLRKDYLRMDEEQLNKIEQNGVPLIERRAASKKAR